jgi:putative FmdB family regulatory protein
MISSRRVRVPARRNDLRSTRETITVPTYQYACTNPEGKHEFEVVQSFSDAPVSECPECGAPVRKVYGSVGVVFKGSGFYRTDSRKSASASESASSNGSSSSKEGSTAPASTSKDSSSSSSPAPAGSSSSSGSGSKAAN